MHDLIVVPLMLAGLALLGLGTYTGVHETSHVGLWLVVIWMTNGALKSAFERLDLWLWWKSGGAIKPKRPRPIKPD